MLHEKLTIEKGMITTVHNITGTQGLVDMVNEKKKDLRRCRSGMLNLAPTSTGSATAVAEVFPELKGKLNGHAIRVPMLNSSITDMVFCVGRETSAEEVNGMLEEASQPGGPLAATDEHGAILGYETKPLVSTDYCNDTRSTIVDAQSTMVVQVRQPRTHAHAPAHAASISRAATESPHPHAHTRARAGQHGQGVCLVRQRGGLLDAHRRARAHRRPQVHHRGARGLVGLGIS